MSSTIVFVTFYGFDDDLRSVRKAMTGHGFRVLSYPLYRFARDENDRLNDVVDHMNKFLAYTLPRVVIWFYADIEPEQFLRIRQKNIDTPFVFCPHYDSEWKL